MHYAVHGVRSPAAVTIRALACEHEVPVLAAHLARANAAIIQLQDLLARG